MIAMRKRVATTTKKENLIGCQVNEMFFSYSFVIEMPLLHINTIYMVDILTSLVEEHVCTYI